MAEVGMCWSIDTRHLTEAVKEDHEKKLMVFKFSENKFLNNKKFIVAYDSLIFIFRNARKKTTEHDWNQPKYLKPLKLHLFNQ